MNLSSNPERKTNSIFYLGFSSLIIAAVFVLSGCAVFGHRRVPPDRFNYNEALAESTRDQMLLNIVRLRYLEEPVFLVHQFQLIPLKQKYYPLIILMGLEDL